MYKKQQLCFSCKKSTGACSWSAAFVPVDGWDAKKHIIPKDNVESYKILSCPLYEYDGLCLRCEFFDLDSDVRDEDFYKTCAYYRKSNIAGHGNCNGFNSIYKLFE